MKARQYSDQIVERTTALLQIDPNERKAVLDLSLQVCGTVIDEVLALVRGYHTPSLVTQAFHTAQIKWRMVVKNVKAVYADHPVHDTHFRLMIAIAEPELHAILVTMRVVPATFSEAEKRLIEVARAADIGKASMDQTRKIIMKLMP